RRGRRARVVTVVGNRPQFVKAAAVSHRLRPVADEVMVHTGQHYDDELSRVFFDELGLPPPEHHLDLGGGSNSSQTARMLAALEALGVEAGAYLLATAHRPGNVDDPARLARLAGLLSGLPHPVVLPLHPRTRARLEASGLVGALDGVRVAPPLGYLDFTALL